MIKEEEPEELKEKMKKTLAAQGEECAEAVRRLFLDLAYFFRIYYLLALLTKILNHLWRK